MIRIMAVLKTCVLKLIDNDNYKLIIIFTHKKSDNVLNSYVW